MKELLLPSLCRNEATRTPDPYVPNVVRYQLRYIPILFRLSFDNGCKGSAFFDMCKIFFYFFICYMGVFSV